MSEVLGLLHLSQIVYDLADLQSNVVPCLAADSAQEVYTASFGSSDGATGLDAALAQDLGPSSKPEHSSPSTLNNLFRSSATGSVRNVFFLDSDVCFWQIARQHLHKCSSLEAAAVPTIGEVRIG